MPVNTNMVRTKQSTLDFIEMLSKFRDGMEAERLTMSENNEGTSKIDTDI